MMYECNDILLNSEEAELFAQYLHICNLALTANKERFPFKQILGALPEPAAPQNIAVRIIDDHPKANHAIHMNADQTLSGCAAEACHCQKEWRVTRSYLEDVIKHADEYINNPAKINWEWMYPLPKAE